MIINASLPVRRVLEFNDKMSDEDFNTVMMFCLEYGCLINSVPDMKTITIGFDSIIEKNKFIDLFCMSPSDMREIIDE